MLVLSGYWLDEGISRGKCRYFRKYMRMKNGKDEVTAPGKRLYK